MNSIASISLSGLSAAQTALSTSAFNIANQGTDGFRRQQVAQRSVAPAGVATSVDESSAEGSDLITDVVGLLQAKNSFLANLAVFKTGANLTGHLLDALA